MSLVRDLSHLVGLAEIGCFCREKGAAVVDTIGGNSKFSEVDIDNPKLLEVALSVLSILMNICVDLVVHAATPFQQTEECHVLEAALKTKTAYVDVCDDTNHAFCAKSFNNKAVATNTPAIISSGIYPGVSSVMEFPFPFINLLTLIAVMTIMAAELVQKVGPLIILLHTYEKYSHLRFFYYTAGTGGASLTILATSFLLHGEEVVAYNKAALTGYSIRRKDQTKTVDLECTNGHNTVGIFSHQRLSVYVFTWCIFGWSIII
ncbi:hypothetical protein UlMin_015609 [Ulmus minor]